MIRKLNIFYFSALWERKRKKKTVDFNISIDVFTDWCFLLKYSLWLLANDLLRSFYVAENGGKKQRKVDRFFLFFSRLQFNLFTDCHFPRKSVVREFHREFLISQMTIGTANSTFLFPFKSTTIGLVGTSPGEILRSKERNSHSRRASFIWQIYEDGQTFHESRLCRG